MARLLVAAAPQAACDLHLALLTVWESGTAEHTGDIRHYRGRWHGSDLDADDEEFKVDEVYEHSRMLSEWRRPDGMPASFAELPIEEDEVAPPDGLDDMEPDEEHFHEATGNEGASFERTYARAALVLWPSARILAVLNQAGLAATLPYLDSLAEQWIAGGAAANSPLKAQARELAGHMLANWPVQPWTSGRSNAGEDTGDKPGDNAAGNKLGIARFLAVLTKLGDRDSIAAALDRLMAQQGHSRADNGAILGSLALFPEERAAELLKAVMLANSVNASGACGGLLRGASAGMFAQQPELLCEAAAALVAALPGDPASSPKDQWGRPRGEKPDAEFIADLSIAADRTDAGLATRMARHVLAWPRHFDPDAVLVPAVKRLSTHGGSLGPAGGALMAAATAHLKTRIALPLEAPRDWARPVNIACKCSHCAELAVFLADPLRESWTLRAAQQHRSHIEAEIRRAHADLDLRTERKGSPHSLICKKNQASHDRRVKQRSRDLADLAVLSATPSG